MHVKRRGKPNERNSETWKKEKKIKGEIKDAIQ